MSEAREGLASGQYLPIVRTAFGSLNCSLVRRSIGILEIEND